MKVNDWVGKYQLVYKRNDPMRGEVWTFMDGDLCIEWIPGGIPTEQQLDESVGRGI